MACHNIMNKMENNCIITNAMDGIESGAGVGAGARTVAGKNTNETGQTVWSVAKLKLLFPKNIEAISQR